MVLLVADSKPDTGQKDWRLRMDVPVLNTNPNKLKNKSYKKRSVSLQSNVNSGDSENIISSRTVSRQTVSRPPSSRQIISRQSTSRVSTACEESTSTMRNLDALPMKYSRKDCIDMSTQRQVYKKNSRRNMRQHSASSGTQSSYSKQLFQLAFLRATTPDLQKENSYPSSSSSLPRLDGGGTRIPPYAYSPYCRHSGPSPYFNTQSANSRSTISATDKNVAEERSKTPKEIHQALIRSNTEFRVQRFDGKYELTANGLPQKCCSSAMSYTDFMLLPSNAGSAVPKSIPEGGIPLDNEIALVKEAISEMNREHDLNNPKPTNQASTSTVEIRIDNGDDRNVDVVMDTGESGSEENDKTQTNSNENLVVPQKKTRPSSAKKGRPSSARSNRSKSGRRKKCWADDATISSVGGKQEDTQNDDVNKTDAPNTDTTNNNNGVTFQDEVTNGVSRLAVKDDGEQRQIMSLKLLHQNQMDLPDFICPASEEKSKQARIRDWLEKTAFNSASRVAPLM